jgi:hypothetical protein
MGRRRKIEWGMKRRKGKTGEGKKKAIRKEIRKERVK